MVFHQGNVDPKEAGLWEEFNRSHCQVAREQLLSLYEPFAKSIAARMYGLRSDDSVSFDDYFQYGRVGLIEAMERYDSGRGVAFGAYSSARIRGAILNGIAKESELASQIVFWRGRQRDRLDSLIESVTPNIDQVSLSEIATITVGLAIGALLEELEDDGVSEPIDPNPQHHPYQANEIRQLSLEVKRLINLLPDKERAVVFGHYIELLEFQQIAEKLSVSKGRISQIHSQAIVRLRGWLDSPPKLDRKL